jgi:phosphoglycolate phosphatase
VASTLIAIAIFTESKPMYTTRDRLIILDADGTLVDAFAAIGEAFATHNMNIGDLDRFQKRHNLFKYLGGIKEFPGNLAKQINGRRRKLLLDTLTEIYRQQATLFPGMAELVRDLIRTPGVRVGMVTRNITHEPRQTLTSLFARHDVDLDQLDFVDCLPLDQQKHPYFRDLRQRLGVNPARAYACGDEHRDYEAALGAGMHPFIAAYGFESVERLTGKFGIPADVIVSTPSALIEVIRHTFDLQTDANSASLSA